MMHLANVIFDDCELDIWKEHLDDYWDGENLITDEFEWAVEARHTDDKAARVNELLSEAARHLYGYVKPTESDYGDLYLVKFLGVLTGHKIPFTVTVELR